MLAGPAEWPSGPWLWPRLWPWDGELRSEMGLRSEIGLVVLWALVPWCGL